MATESVLIWHRVSMKASFTTLDGLHAILDQHFRLITAPKEVPFVIRETQHKFQHSLSEVTFWERIK